MVQLMIRLQNHGKKNHRYWWIVVQPKNKHFQGRILEKVGIWAPRKTKTVDRMISINRYKIKYWLSVGATPTDGAHRLLHFAGLLPKKPIPFGSQSLYSITPKPYAFQYFHKHRWGLQNPEHANLFHYEKIKKMESILKTKLQIDNEAINEIVRPRDLNFKSEKTEYHTDMNTDDLNSDDFDFYSRKRNFDIVSKKLNKYFETQYQLYRGNDYKYNNYLRKLEKLSKNESLDYEGFKDYLEAVKNLNESKNNVLENIGQHFLNELLNKESTSKEIGELIKLANLDNNNTKDNSKDNNLKEKFSDLFNKSSHKDTAQMINALNYSFENAAKQIFKVSQEENFTNKEFQDIKNLRLAKIMIKLRLRLLDNIRKEKEELEGKDKTIYNKKSKNNQNQDEDEENSQHSNFFTSIFDNLKSSDVEDIPLFDKELYKEIIDKHIKAENYDDLLFQNINNYLLSTETFKKFKPVLFNKEFYGNENLSNEENQKLISNPNIYLISNQLIDEMINSLMDVLSRKYEVNEIYRDEETDLNQFEKDEAFRVNKRTEMEEKNKKLKTKYGDFDVIYDKLIDKSAMNEVNKFRREYETELFEKFDEKFKRDLRITRPEMTGGKYYTPEEIEEEKGIEDKYYRMKDKIMKEIEMIKLGKNVKVEEKTTEEVKTEELSEEDKKMEHELRERLYFISFPPEDPLYNIIPLPNENRPEIDFNPFINMYRRKYKKEPKVENQDEILKLNKIKLRRNQVLLHSLQESRAIPVPRQREMMKRFIDYFGNYNDVMYPEGFRHLENFDAYQSVFPLKTVADYQTELHTFCDFDTFVMISYGAVNQIKKIGLMGLEFPELFDRAEYLSIYLKSKSSEFINSTLKDVYKKYLQIFDERGVKFNLIDALEQVAAFNLNESTIPEMKKLLISQFNERFSYIGEMNHFNMMNYPNLSERGEDMNLSRQGPFMPINPLKAHKANPTFNTPMQIKKNKFHIPNGRRRLYKGFCTLERINYLH